MTHFNFEIPKLQATNATGIAKELDKKDGKEDGKISASIWNEFVADKGGKTIKYSIDIENAKKSISTYLYRNSNVNGESKDNIASEWLMKLIAPKKNENEAGVVEETVKSEQQSIAPDEVFNKAENYAKNKYGRYRCITRGANDTIYVDVNDDQDFDIAFNNQGGLIYDLLDTPNPPKGSAKKSVWYNPLTWF